MKILQSATAITAAALLALTLAGCAPAADTSTDTGSTDSGDTSTDEGATTGDLITLSGTGDYTVGVTAPIGGYELKDVDSQPDGCTWALEDADGKVQFENQGTTVFITDVNAFFQTSGCPDWVQFE